VYPGLAASSADSLVRGCKPRHPLVYRHLVQVDKVEMRACGVGCEVEPVMALHEMLLTTAARSLRLLDLRGNSLDKTACEKLRSWGAKERLAELEAGVTGAPSTAGASSTCKVLLSGGNHDTHMP